MNSTVFIMLPLDAILEEFDSFIGLVPGRATNPQLHATGDIQMSGVKRIPEPVSFVNKHCESDANSKRDLLRGRFT